MNAVVAVDALKNGAAERSAVYAVLARSFTYEGSREAPFSIAGADFNAAFDPSVAESAVSIREGSYTDEDTSALFEELVRFYQFFGLKRIDNSEMPDHISVELEFMHFLTHLECQAQDKEALASLHRAQLDFLNRHLRRVLKGARSKFVSSSSACVDLMRTCVEFVESEAALIKSLVDEQGLT